MKKFTIAATIMSPLVSMEEVMAALRSFGVLNVTYQSEVDVVDAPLSHKDAIWLRVPYEEGDEWMWVDKPGFDWLKIQEINESGMDFLTKNGVCIEFHAYYPNSDKYGTPFYASDDDYAHGVIGEHGFAVANDAVIFTEDRGDDSSEDIFLKISLTSKFKDWQEKASS